MKNYIIFYLKRFTIILLVLEINPGLIISQSQPPNTPPYDTAYPVLIQTPKGENVSAVIYTDRPEWVAYWEDFGDSLINVFHWTHVTRLEGATHSYNCHGYAWYTSEGEENVWINFYQLSPFWTGNQSYIVSENNTIGRKVRYTDDDHSAITTGSNFYVKSKWGKLPLYYHYKDECPYVPTNLAYYELNPNMTGSTGNLCYNVNRDFNTNITNMSEGTLTWTKGNNLSVISEYNDSVFTVKGGSSFGWSYVKLEINTPSGYHWDNTKNFWTGLFNQTWVSGTAAVCPNITYTYVALVPGGHSPTYTYYWTYPTAWSKISQYQNNIQLRTTSTPIGGTVRVAINNECGTSAYSGITVYPGSCYYHYSLYPNPASDEVTITIDEPEIIIVEDTEIAGENVMKAIPTDQITYTIRIYNRLGTLVSLAIRTGISFSIPLNNLRDGTYIVELSDGKNSFREQLIIKRE